MCSARSSGANTAGFERLNLDLIYGTPAESPADWRRSLEGALALGVDHISAYALTVEPATALGRQVAAGAPAPDDDLQADAYSTADSVLGAAGLEWYEVSNWARPGEACRHNELYWTGGEYAAIGSAAHGHTDDTRWWNVRTPERYIAAVAAGTSARAGEENLDAETRAEEAFSLALRTRSGATCDPQAATVVAELAEEGVLERDGPRIVLTPARSPARVRRDRPPPARGRRPARLRNDGPGRGPQSAHGSGTRYH